MTGKKKFVDVVVVIPVGPGTNHLFIQDTISSFINYTSSSYKIVLVDDSHQGIAKKVKEVYPDIDIVYTTKNSGSMAGLYLTLSQGFSYALLKYDFTVLFKIDTDALIIGENPEQEAIELFEKNPDTGIAGQYPMDYDGTPWDTGWPKARIINGTKTWKFIRRPISNILLRKLYIQALKNGYKTGESVFGGAYFMSKKFVKELHQNKFLPNRLLGNLNLGEDHLFSLIACYFGYRLGDLSSGQLPFACAWKGLPASPQDLILQGKKIIHSTRYWNEMKEEKIREYFKSTREQFKQEEISTVVRSN